MLVRLKDAVLADGQGDGFGVTISIAEADRTAGGAQQVITVDHTITSGFDVPVDGGLAGQIACAGDVERDNSGCVCFGNVCCAGRDRDAAQSLRGCLHNGEAIACHSAVVGCCRRQVDVDRTLTFGERL